MIIAAETEQQSASYRFRRGSKLAVSAEVVCSAVLAVIAAELLLLMGAVC